ncbi:MAG: Lsr2 family protein [Aeromicrobium sp.]|uniref:histone-like nucleoid-structuring protein Lsr2 n=1 Tax=Aeromicrobium sp. TaxID=1871063 RepID=UPI0039E4EF46
MAKRTIDKYFSDLSAVEIESGSPTVYFAFAGTSYEIDLTEAEAEEFAQVLAPYIAAGQRVTGTRGARRAAAKSGGPSPKEIRAWAEAQGLDVPTRGRIPAAVQDAFAAAH